MSGPARHIERLVVVGLGYVGLTLAREAAAAGIVVSGLDVDPVQTAKLNAGRSTVDTVGDDEVVAMTAAGFHATTDPGCLDGCDAAVICVPTPLHVDGTPDLSAVEAAAVMVSDHLSPGMLVVLESTTYPGTTEDVVRPLLEVSGLKAGTDFALGYSPERIDPGNPQWGLRNTPKLVSGLTPECEQAAARLYKRLVDTVVPVARPREAEMAKLLENTYRQVNIALANELATACDEMGIDLWEVIAAAATKPFGFTPFYPGPGVGGHCIPVDPSYLSYRVRLLGHPLRLVELAQEINQAMPGYVAMRAQRLLNDHGKALKGAAVLLLGVTFKADVADQRGAPAEPLALRLLARGANVSYHDPYVPMWRVGGQDLACAELPSALNAADLVVIVQGHQCYDPETIGSAARLVLDTRGRVNGAGTFRL